MIQTEVHIDPKSLQRLLDTMDPKQAQKAHVLVLNKLAARGRKISKEAFVKRYNVRPRDVKVMTRRASTHNPRAYIYGRMRPYSLHRFRPEEIATGVQVEIIRGQTIMIPGAFIETPHGVSYKSQGQQRTKSSRNPVMLKRAGMSPYKLLGGNQLLRKDQQASLGRFVTSGENRSAIQAMIKREAPALLQQTIDDQVRRRVSKLGIDVGD